jgi:NAD(P)-dependent dehydrogenase (short-subunit alcohol dehydrogenase family)
MYLEKFRLDGRRAWVTGAARGIGAAIARALAEAGATVVIADIDAEAAAKTASALTAEGFDVHSRRVDLAVADEVEALADEVTRSIGVVDILVNNAGVAIVTDPLDTSEADWRRTMSINTDGVYYCAKAFGRHMKAKGAGAIVNIGSLAGFVATRPQNPVAYATSKGAVHMMTRSLAVAFAPHGVRVNAVAPSYVASDMIDPAKASGEFAEWFRIWMDSTPMARLGQPEEIASAVLFLASDAASFCTGVVLPVDGGYGSI